MYNRHLAPVPAHSQCTRQIGYASVYARPPGGEQDLASDGRGWQASRQCLFELFDVDDKYAKNIRKSPITPLPPPVTTVSR